jgi:hypothetical protein
MSTIYASLLLPKLSSFFDALAAPQLLARTG